MAPQAASAAPTPNFRRRLANIMAATVADEQAAHTWTYHALRPMPVPPAWKRGQKVTGDCSKGVQYLCKWVGARDPMQEDFGPYGNSQTLWLRCQHLDNVRELQVGDIVTFGRDGLDHAAMVLEAPSAANGWDPLLWSFGHQGAPNTYRLSADHRPAQFLRNPLPTYVPTTADRCRARTGWFAWVAWKLGEGDWQTFGPKNPTVRPDVPRVIPPGWWARYARFLANRKQGNKPTTSA